MSTRYWQTVDDDEVPIGLIRMVTDDGNQTLDLEYLTKDGSWKNDPSLIDDIHDAHTSEIQPSEVTDIVDMLTGGKAHLDVAATTPDEEVVPMTPAEVPKPE